MFEYMICYLYMNMKDKTDISSIVYVTIMVVVFVLAM